MLKDPNSEGSRETIVEQVEMVREIRGHVNQVVDLIDRIEWLRARLRQVRMLLADREGLDGLRTRADSLEQELVELEMNLFDLRLTGGTAGQDRLRWPRRLYARLVSLAGYVSGTDHRPTDQAREVHRVLQERLTESQDTLSRIVDEDVASLDRRLRERGIESIGFVAGG